MISQRVGICGYWIAVVDTDGGIRDFRELIERMMVKGFRNPNGEIGTQLLCKWNRITIWE